ncbi:YcxB-like protein [Acetitomaculum ruminis DSM 5522]|uniref:YcxB-like protein n=1 Tax=Acetitomaculum ruminis DSM 5522 TaxID=1120918 RepID=A0A1I0ZBA7_9FIRM|nr:YcxB family protein [Acetitomaculum ruminis]SFB21513.1 YcxB-like protein [Acetitomaculum ruminis DSM 5522]
MKAEADIKLSADDVYDFTMYHVYSKFSGIFSIILGILIIGLAVYTYDTVSLGYTIIYLLVGVIFIAYNPVALKLKAKKQFTNNQALASNIHYIFDEKGVHSTLANERADVEWVSIFKVVETRRNFLIYTTTINASIIPKSQLGETESQIRQILSKHLDTYQNRLKKR